MSCCLVVVHIKHEFCFQVVLMYKLVAGGAILFRIIETAFPVCFVCVADMTQQGKRGELVVVTQKAVQIYCLGRN